jgi:hypothetical protein
MSNTRSIIRSAGKRRREAEQSLAEIIVDIQDSTDSEMRLLSTLAQIESLIRQVNEKIACEGLDEELSLLRNHAIDRLAICHDLLRHNRARTAHLDGLKADLNRIASQAAQIVEQAAQIHARN